MTEPPTRSRGNSPRGGETTKLRVPFEKMRWRYQRDGRDYGPWTSRQMLEHLWDGKLDGDTEAYEEWNERWFRIGSVPEFAQELARIQQDDASRKLEHEATRAGKNVRSTRIRHWGIAIGGILSVSAAIAATLLLNDTGPREPHSSLLGGLYASLDIETLEPSDLVVENKDKYETVELKKAKRISRRAHSNKRNGRGATLVPTGSKGAVAFGSRTGEQTLDFTASATPQEKNRFEQSVYRRIERLRKPLLGCLETEANSRSTFQSAKFVFRITNKGKIEAARVVNSGKVSQGFLTCVKRAAGTFQVKPYTGSSIEVNLKVNVVSRN